MVVATPATMEEGRIMLVGNETDILHSAFNFPINESGKRYPSADHYAHAQILTQLGLDEIHILTLLATSSVNVSKKARQLLQENMPSGHDMNSLSHYLTVSRQSYTMMGLRLRAEQDKRFRQTLMETGDSLLIVCDRRDAELGIGMDDDAFVQFARRRMANAERISAWMHEERQRPKELGQNQLGFFLMWLRYELREKEKTKWLSTTELKVDGLIVGDQQEEKPMQISVSDFVLALQGPFQPLSNYYAIIFEFKGSIYRSVEHYAYQRLFEALRLSEEEVMKIRTTVKPVDIAKLAKRVFTNLQLDTTEVEHKSTRLDRWRQSAMKAKITKNEYLQKLLLSTGHAILLETTAEADPKWSCGTTEFEFQHLLTKKYVTPQLLIDWQCERVKLPGSLAHLGNNRVGLGLMQLRAKLASTSTHKMPLISPLSSSVLRSSVSNHMICFTPESVLHPFYPSEIRINETTTFPSAAHMTAQMAIKFLNVNGPDAEWIMEAVDAPECWERLHIVICHQMQLPLEKIQQWYMEERQVSLKEAMKLQFDQNPALMRVLLDTQDALLVSCARFSAPEAELNIGMRERDLRLWLSHVHQDSKQLMDICLRPMALRPPYFGGNRLGFLLMELRREFILAGVFPHQLPEMGQSVDAILGSESPMENYVSTIPFDVLDEINFTAIWANPFLLMLKQQLENGGPETLTEHWEKAALSKKQAPMLISRDETQISGVFERLFLDQNSAAIGEDGQPILENGHNTNGGDGNLQMDSVTSLDVMAPEMVRSVYIKMANQFRQKLAEMDEMQRQIGVRSRDSNRLQELRRALERNRENLNAVSQWWKSQNSQGQSKSNAIGMREGGGGREQPSIPNKWDQSWRMRVPWHRAEEGRGIQQKPGQILRPLDANQIQKPTMIHSYGNSPIVKAINPNPNIIIEHEQKKTANLVENLMLQAIRTEEGGRPSTQTEQNKTIHPPKHPTMDIPNRINFYSSPGFPHQAQFPIPFMSPMKKIQLERLPGNVPATHPQGLPPTATQQSQQQPDSSTTNTTAPPIQQQSSTGAVGAEWTQAAAISSGRRLSPPPPLPQRTGPPPPTDDFGRPPIGGQPTQAVGPMGSGKIPSLFPEFGVNGPNSGPGPIHHQQQPPHLPPPPHFMAPPHGRGPLPPQLSTTQPIYGSGGRRGGEPPPYSDRRAPPPPSRFERSGPSRRGNGRRGGGHFGGPYDRSSRSPPSYQNRRRTRTPPPPRHRQMSPPHHPNRSQQQPSSGRGSQQRSSSSSISTPTTTAPPAAPAVKKPKRVVDESELSEGEILSDED